MFYRQKINELCYMYVYLGTVQCLCMYYVHVVKLSVHVRRPSSFSRIRLDSITLFFRVLRTDFACWSYQSPVSWPFSNFQWRRRPRQSSSAANFNNRNTGDPRSSLNHSVKSREAITQLLNYCACHNTALSQHTSTYRVCSITTVVSPSFVNFFVID